MNIQENVAEILLAFVIWSANGAWNFLEGAFTYTDITDDSRASLWVAVIGGTLVYEQDGESLGVVNHPGLLNIMVGAMIPLLVIFVALQVITSAVRKSSAGFLRAAVMMIVAVPATYIAAGLMWFVMGATSSVSQWILSVGADDSDGDELGVADGPRAILSMFGLHFASDDTDSSIMVDEETGLILDENSAHLAGLASLENAGVALGAVVIIGLLCLAAGFLALMMMFRLVALLILATFLPVATFSLTWEASKAIAVKWFQITAALVIAEPAAAGILRLGGAIAVLGDDWINIALGFAVLLMAGIMPIATMSLISWMTGGAGDGVDRLGGQVGRAATRQGHSASRRVSNVSRRALRR